MRLGLFGGSFDPVHLGHLLVAQAALEELKLDRLVFIPAAQSPFKPDMRPTPGPLRLRMLRLALAGETRFDVDASEIQRGGVSYSVETARAYAALHPSAELFWLIGADHVPTLPQWRAATELAGLVEFVAIPRPGAAPAVSPPEYQLRQLAGWPLDVSSSEIRARVAAGRPIHRLVPPAVADVITAERLYKSEMKTG
jgi:nicotinate-nucleotide adenylyltransferase